MDVVDRAIRGVDDGSGKTMTYIYIYAKHMIMTERQIRKNIYY